MARPRQSADSIARPSNRGQSRFLVSSSRGWRAHSRRSGAAPSTRRGRPRNSDPGDLRPTLVASGRTNARSMSGCTETPLPSGLATFAERHPWDTPPGMLRSEGAEVTSLIVLPGQTSWPPWSCAARGGQARTGQPDRLCRSSGLRYTSPQRRMNSLTKVCPPSCAWLVIHVANPA
jgi:hypothetical protein